jgi:Spy/CpxP family protein refolding chaperone
MSRVRCFLILAMVLVLGASLLSAAQAQVAATAAERGPRGAGMMGGRTSLVGLLSLGQVQKELKLSEEQVGKVKEVTQKLQEEMQEQSAALKEITDPEARRAKRTELSDQLDRKVREQLREVLSREQMMRLYQIRIQVGGPLSALNNPRIADRLKLTDEQKKKVAEIQKATQQKTTEARRGMQGLSQEERRQRTAQLREITNKADEEALGVLTAEQKEAFEKSKGEKFELQSRRGQP